MQRRDDFRDEERGGIGRFGLYGEAPGAIAPEFVHIEPISVRSSLYEWSIAPHSHPGIHQLLLIARGGGVLASDGRELALDPVTLVAIPSGCVHAFAFDPGAEGWVLSVAADLLHDPRIAALGALAMFAGRGAGRAQGAAVAARLPGLLAHLAEDLAAAHAGWLGNRIAANLALVLASAEELLGAAVPTPAPPARREALAEAFRRLVDLRFRDGWTVDAYAAALGTTPPTLTRAIRAVLGKPPGEVVLERQLLEAMRYLTYTAASVQQIAGYLGFADPAYFARFFKRRTGITASDFRQRRAWLEPR